MIQSYESFFIINEFEIQSLLSRIMLTDTNKKSNLKIYQFKWIYFIECVELTIII